MTVLSTSLHVPVATAAASIAKTIVVNPSGTGDFRSVQEAVNSVPDYNNQWIKIHLASGVYRGEGGDRRYKSYILLEGEGAQKTSIEWGDYASDSRGHDTASCGTFTSYASNIVVAGITFKNTYDGYSHTKQAVAALIAGDKSSLYSCGFVGYQDTLADLFGRHYFKGCYIQGVTDFIFGLGQSIYEGCTISTANSVEKPGFVTAQGRGAANDTNGFVFKRCNVTGPQATYLGRAWGRYSRVIFYQTFMSDIIVPEGWSVWNAHGYENEITYAESECTGPGSKQSGRVRWKKTLTSDELRKFTDISYIDGEGWLGEQPQY
ncbi:pectinesterase [Musa troglodytarum]|uniref:pectinesterase n=2 Tax=Musa troglodytarum TaxID=320322 RepID=A0A9E7EKS3_9LILI|nr:pectinesterase [Musa troglodytarum]